MAIPSLNVTAGINSGLLTGFNSAAPLEYRVSHRAFFPLVQPI